MKLKVTEARSQKPEARSSAADGCLPVSGLQPSTFNLQPSQRGVALIITLILLSVTLVMAVAFLALSRRDRSSVATTTDTAYARLAVESALAQAQAQLVAGLGSTNPYSFPLLVSTNYINYNGFDPSGAGPTNVNFDYTSDGSGYSLNDFLSSLTNLEILPRVPVYMTNYVAHDMENSFYLDLNRNGIFDTNNWPAGQIAEPGDPEWIGVLQRPDAPHSANNRFIVRYAFIAVPADGTLDLNYIHNQVFDEPPSPTYPAIIPVNSAPDGYFRNQGVGTWEINLAAFLADLNTNEWDSFSSGGLYQYRQPNLSNIGQSFVDAQSLLAYRYNNNYNSLAPASLALNNASVLSSNNIDDYSDGPLQTNLDTNADYLLPDKYNLPWAGADNTNHYYELSSDLFNSNNVPSFAQDLTYICQSYNTTSTDPTNSYNRSTFYRLLDQMGVNSQPEQGKLNLNYSNAVVNYDFNGVVTNITIIPGAETNLVPWRPLDFFTAAADKMLRTYTTNWFRADPSNYLANYYGTAGNYFYSNSVAGIFITNSPDGFGLTNAYFGTNMIPAFGITNIPVYVNGVFVYSPAVNRVLQLAANLYDASTTNFYPSVFRPDFLVTNEFGYNNVYIKGYEQVPSINGYIAGNGTNNIFYAAPPLIIPTTVEALALKPGYYISQNVYGVPWIIGAKKYLPGLNQFSLVNSAQVTRKLQVARNFFGGPIWTNQMYVIGITNNLGVSFWNSYTNGYPTNYGGFNVSIYVSDLVQMTLAVTNSPSSVTPYNFSFATNYVISPASWPGSKWGANGGGEPAANSFIATNWVNTLIPQLVYKTGAGQFAPTNDISDPWETNVHVINPLPQFGLLTTNWLRTVIVDNTNVIDYVQLRGPIDATNLTSALADPDYPYPFKTGELQWSTNLHSGVPYGVVNQIDVSRTGQHAPTSGGKWSEPPQFPATVTDNGSADEANFFNSMFDPNSKYTVGGVSYTNYELVVQAPYTPSRTIYGSYLYQVNDPLVHYLASDLDAGKSAVWAANQAHANGVWIQDDDTTATPLPTPPTVDIINGRYQPWGRNQQMAKLPQVAVNAVNAVDQDAYNLTCKDPLVWSADYWDFPTNKYPSVGWIGRVHRGTPWQTVYLKAHNVMKIPDITPSQNITWNVWTGDYNLFDATNSAPLQDRLLFDMFTTAPNENASRGQLSVNQTHLASWSALFSGMVVITNTTFMTSNYHPTPTNSWMVISPAGVNGLNSALGDLVTNIDNQRAGFTNADGLVGAFEHKGDILSVAPLTEQSPFLNWNNSAQQDYGISDEAYEWLPQQMMSLLDCPSAPRYVIYCYGQTLKPAPDSIATGGNFFGLCTNYQVVAESAARAVVQVHSVVVPNPNGGFKTNYTTTVESYNQLPPN